MPTLLIKKLIIKNDEDILVDLISNNIPIKIDSTLALVGQSGSGKSLTLKTILNLMPSNLQWQFDYDSNFDLNTSNIGFIPQNPFTSLSPLTKITKQFFCNYETKIKMLQLVGLDINILSRFPSQLSGGQLQRIVIAIALSTNPKLLLLDEPTTALDTKNKKIIFNLLLQLQKEMNLLMIYVTHDISSINKLCNDIIILKNGNIVEQGLVINILKKPKEIYTKQLIESSFENRDFRI